MFELGSTSGVPCEGHDAEPSTVKNKVRLCYLVALKSITVIAYMTHLKVAFISRVA